MAGKLVANSSTTIKAAPARVWTALTDPELNSQVFFGAQVKTDWRAGSPITFSGEWEGKQFVDKGEIVRFVPTELLQLTHFSPMSGQEDVPENYHTVTFELAPRDGGTEVAVTQDGVGSEEERTQSEATWSMMLDGLRKAAEG